MIAFTIIFGFLIGSFLNVIIFRLPRNESVVLPGSHCPCCGHGLRMTDMLPLLSYVWLGGRCRYCQATIAWRYPMVELLTAATFLTTYIANGMSFRTLVGWTFTSILIIAAFTDIETGLIPNRITYPGILIGFLISVFTLGYGNALGGLVIFAGTFLGIAILCKGGLGGGDVKLAGMIGVFLGWQGSITTFAVSSLTGGLWAVLLLASGRANRKSKIKFGPFLAASAWVVWIMGSGLIDSFLFTGV